MQMVIVTGLSGAGKATAARAFEDMAFAVTDNLPPKLLPALASNAENARVAVVVDARAGESLADLDAVLDELRASGVKPTILFLDASDEVLIRRYSETRRPHPTVTGGGIAESLTAERELLEPVKARTDRVLDTSNLSVTELRAQILADFGPEPDKNGGLTLTFTSFGFKYGLPLDADLVFDVRFLDNPHYVETLRPLNGRDAAVEEYVLADPDSGPFLEKVRDFLIWSVPQYVGEGKAYLTVATGCTGGRHRSVVISEKLAGFLRTAGYAVRVTHRDVEKARL